MDFKTMDINAITSGVNGDGIRYLQLFLKEYTSIFDETVNPGCNKCLNTYLNKYKLHFMKQENISGYVLHLKYENIPLEFGSPILVNNGNITKEYAKKLLSQPDGERYFEVILEDNSSEEEKLQDAVNNAQAKLDALPEKEHHTRIKATQNALEKAKQALEQYQIDNLEVKDVEVIETVITDENLTTNPELSEAGIKAGDTVLIDKNEYDEKGTISIVEKPE
jgi:predicted  nucleic acid-binding Zn-ribbon protein